MLRLEHPRPFSRFQCYISSLKLDYVCVLISENSQCRQGILHCWRNAAVRQVQVAETLHESVRRYSELFFGRFQSVATQMLPTQQLDSMQLKKFTSSVCSLQQSAVL